MTWSWRRVGVSAINSRRAKNEANEEDEERGLTKTESNRKNDQQGPRGTDAGVNNAKIVESSFVSLGAGDQPVADNRTNGRENNKNTQNREVGFLSGKS